MGVIIECQSVVTDVVHGIACFLHGTDGYGFNKVLLFLPLNIIQQMVDGFGYIRFGSAGAQFVAEAGNELCQVIQFFRVRKVVNTIGEYFGFLLLGTRPIFSATVRLASSMNSSTSCWRLWIP